MFIESLEQRQLLSASLSGGVLTVTGTAENDVITFRIAKDGTTGVKQIVVSEQVRPADGSDPDDPTETRFDLSSVTSIVVNAGAGDDVVGALCGRRGRNAISLPMTINGEDGNDRLGGGS